jgi:hypothetical protein
MDVKCAQGCSFSTGSCSDSVHELAGKTAHYQTNSPWLAARTPLRCCFLNWILRGLTLDLGRAFFLLTLRVFYLLLIGEGSKGDQLYGGGTG